MSSLDIRALNRDGFGFLMPKLELQEITCSEYKFHLASMEEKRDVEQIPTINMVKTGKNIVKLRKKNGMRGNAECRKHELSLFSTRKAA